MVAMAFVMAINLGSVNLPRLSEGAIALNIIRLAGTPIEDSIEINTRMEQEILREFPNEVAHIWSRIGAAEIATDPMGIELTDTFIALTPRDLWTRARTQDELTTLIEHHLRDLPGQQIAYLQPIELRMNEMVTGVRSDIAVRLYGDDLHVLVEKGREIEGILNQIPGSADVSTEQVTGQPVLQIKLKQSELARHGVPAKVVTDIVESLGSKRLGEVVEGQLTFPLVARLPDDYRGSVEQIRSILIPTPSGERLPLERLADVSVIEGPSTISREWGQRSIAVSANVRGRDVGSYVAEAQKRLNEDFTLPPGRYWYKFGGQYEQLQRFWARMWVVVPLTILLIFSLLYVTYNNVVDALRVFVGVPFAMVGGVFALWMRDMPMSISAAIGFIAVSGVAVLDDMILVSYIRQLRRKGLGLNEAVMEAAQTRLRPVLMTTLVASLGFLPMAVSTGVGAEVQRPLATVVIGGVIGAMAMSLLVLRVLYVVIRSPFERGDDGHAQRFENKEDEEEQAIVGAGASF
jgi:cobalt-zinc-cadmium resistance protein CzcA